LQLDDVKLSRWRPLRHFTWKSAAICWVCTQPGAYAAASVSAWSRVHSIFFEYSYVWFVWEECWPTC